MPVRTDPRESKRYWNRLEEYCSKHVLNPKSGFCCEHGEACRDSAESRSNAFAAGQLSYVGDRYAVEAEGIPMRILVVPMQVGRDEVVDMDKRRGQILGRIENPRNPHMRGVVQVLQVLFGLEPGGVVEKIHNNSHVLEAYAMANSVLCSNLPTGGKSRRGEPTRTMWKNCREHLRQTIVLLKPTIIVTQGNAPRDALGTVVDRCEPIGDRVDRVTVGGVQATWCKLWHPAAPRYWGDAGHFREIAVPALRHVRHLALSQQPAPLEEGIRKMHYVMQHHPVQV